MRNTLPSTPSPSTKSCHPPPPPNRAIFSIFSPILPPFSSSVRSMLASSAATPCPPLGPPHPPAVLRQIKSEPDLAADSQQPLPELKAHPSPPLPLIDTSTPESLERDFHAWLKGELKTRRTLSCSHSCSEPVSMYLSPLLKGEQLSPVAAAGPTAADDGCGQMDYAILQPLLANGERRISLPPVHFKEEPFPLLSAGQSPSSSSHSSEGCSPLQQQQKLERTTKNGDGQRGGERAAGEMVLTEIGTMTRPSAQMMVAGTDAGSRAQMDSPGSRSSGVNQLGRTYSPGLPLSMSERQQIVELHQTGWKICDISKFLCVTHSCVSKILQRYRTTGSVRPKDAKEGRQESPLVSAIRDYRLRLGIVRQSEIREQLIRDGLCRRENAPSRSSINHILRTKLNIGGEQKKLETANEDEYC